MKLLGIIPARGGSKGIPGKNIKLLGGKPLLAYTIEAARKADIFARVILTTDSAEIAAVGKEYGAETPFMRPPELAFDDTPMLPVLQHAVRALGEKYDGIVILQPTAPFRRWQDLQAAAQVLSEHPEAESVVSVEQVPEHYSPYFVMKINGQKLLPFMPDGLRITRRQDAPKAYSRSGDFYFTRIGTLMEGNSIYGENCRPFVVSHELRVNLDTLDDWAEAERLVGEFLAGQ